MKTIILVEDDPSVMTLLAAVIQSMGHRLVSASTFTTALAAWQETPCDLALIDFNLADRSGVELAEQFLAERPATLVIIMSGSLVTRLPISKGLRDKIGFLEKPFSVSTLQQKIKDALNNH